MSLGHRCIVALAKRLTGLLCRVYPAPLSEVPSTGPLIIVTNHVNILEIPIIYAYLQPRPVTGLVLAERWHNPFFRWLLDTVDAIPIRREADVTALRRALEALKAGRIVIIAPEGTRSGDGRLLRGHPGIVLLALRSGAPILPVVYHGSENYRRELRCLRRAPFHITVGRPFHLDPAGAKVNRQVRRLMVDEIMYQLAALLPPGYRGAYADLEHGTRRFLI